MARYTKKRLKQLEYCLRGANYTLRYEKGQFNSAACRLRSNNVLIINKYLSLESRIELLSSLVQSRGIDLPTSST